MTLDESTKLAVIGMGAQFGTAGSLDQFEYAIHSGQICIGSLQNLSLSTSHSEQKQIDTLSDSQLAYQVAEQAINDANLAYGEHVAVLVITSADPSSSNTASEIAAHWGFTGPTLMDGDRGGSIAHALEKARGILLSKQAHTVLIIAVQLYKNHPLQSPLTPVTTANLHTMSFDQKVSRPVPGEGAGAVVVRLYNVSSTTSHLEYAIIQDIRLSVTKTTPSETPSFNERQFTDRIVQTGRESFQALGLLPQQVGYHEVAGTGIPDLDKAEIESLTHQYRRNDPASELSCAVGSSKSIVGHTGYAAGMASLIQTVLCLSKRFIPATPNWSTPKNLEKWKNTNLYIPGDSRTWFTYPEDPQRYAAMLELSGDHSIAHLILTDGITSPSRGSGKKVISHHGPFLLPIAANDQVSLQKQLQALSDEIHLSDDLAVVAQHAFRSYQEQNTPNYSIGIIARNSQDALRELCFAAKGVDKAFELGCDWQSPGGSYFTPSPVGKSGKVAFVYPGAFNSYPGVGRDLIYLFPEIYDMFSGISSNSAAILREKLLYPRSLEAISPQQLTQFENQLSADAVSMLSSGSGLAVLYTLLLRNIFMVQPDCAFGYSLGESSMMFAFQVWTDGDRMEATLESSSLFKSRISGDKLAVREYWGIDSNPPEIDQDLWGNYLIMESPEIVQEHINNADRVYMTHINTPKQVVIAGDPQQCRQVIADLNRPALKAPFDQVLHCEAMASEYSELVDLHTRRVENHPDIPLLSAADYLPLRTESRSIAKSIAKSLCTPLDFPKLINQAYQNGARVFIELGAGSNCAKWIEDSLKGKEHTAFSLDRRNLDNHSAILRAMAKMVSHRVSLDLGYLYAE